MNERTNDNHFVVVDWFETFVRNFFVDFDEQLIMNQQILI